MWPFGRSNERKRINDARINDLARRMSAVEEEIQKTNEIAKQILAELIQLDQRENAKPEKETGSSRPQAVIEGPLSENDEANNTRTNVEVD